MKNKITDLNNLLFEQLERLIDAEDDEIEKEINRSRAVSSIATNIVSTADLTLKATEIQLEYGLKQPIIPQLGNKNEKETKGEIQ